MRYLNRCLFYVVIKLTDWSFRTKWLCFSWKWSPVKSCGSLWFTLTAFYLGDHESAHQEHVLYGAKEPTLQSFWHLIPISCCHDSSTTSLAEVLEALKSSYCVIRGLTGPQFVPKVKRCCCLPEATIHPFSSNSSSAFSWMDICSAWREKQEKYLREKMRWKVATHCAVCEHIPQSLLWMASLFHVAQCVEDFCSFTQALALIQH